MNWEKRLDFNKYAYNFICALFSMQWFRKTIFLPNFL